MKEKFKWYYLGFVTGLVLLGVGIPMAVFTDIAVLPFVLLGLGAGMFTGALGGVITMRMMKKDAAFARQIETEMTDERNVTIQLKAKAGTHDFISVLLWAVVIFLAAMGVELWIVLLVVSLGIVRMAMLFYLMGN
jgi:hypothetical protein